MAIEKSVPLSASTFQPRLLPKQNKSLSFEATLASTLGEAPPLATLPAGIEKQTRQKPTVNEVRGVVVRPEECPQKDQQVSPPCQPGEFTLEEEAVLKVWAKSVNTPPRPPKPAKVPSLDMPPSEAAATAAADPDTVIKTAAAQVGKRYAAGGESPRQGFDCSGLTSYAYSQSGLDIPRNSREQFQQGTPVPREELKKGDLVFFGKRGVNHVGIYVADGNFVHATSSRGVVKMSSLDEPIWNKLYAGARRVF
jgi:cell wall-associated NlpC family hydrolase